MKKLIQSLLPVTLAAIAFGASAQAYPDKTITLVVPFAAGGPTDKVARDLAEALRKPLGQTIIVENAAGAGGAVGAGKVARAPADGYTLLLHHISMATMPSLLRSLQFNVLTDFEYLGMINDVPMTIIGKTSLPANNYKELVSWMHEHKGKINLGNAGVGSASHLCGMLFQHAVGIDMTAVPYKGTGPAMTDLMGGQIDLMCDQTTNTTGAIEAKKVKVFAVTTPKRLSVPALKDVPTMQELGVKDFQVTIFHGLYAPKGTPAPVLKKINDALKVALKDPDFIKREEALGAVIVTDKRLQPAEHKKFVEAQIKQWTPLIKAAGVYVE